DLHEEAAQGPGPVRTRESRRGGSMSDSYEFVAVDRITFGAIGPPGRRTFYLQARAGLESVTLLVEKDHVIALSEGTEEIFKAAGYPQESIEWDADSMVLEEPLEPAFR